jgi:hypothetical protein
MKKNIYIMKMTKLIINERGIILNGKRIASFILEKIKGLWMHTPTTEEIEEIGPENKLVIGDKAVINLPGGVPVNIIIDGNVYGKIDISSCNSFEIKGNMKGNINLSSGNLIVNGDIEGDIRSGSSTINVGGGVDGDIKISAGTINIKE